MSADFLYFAELNSKIIEKIIEKYADDDSNFFNENQESALALLDGSIGTLLVLMAYLNKNRFLGDYIFNII
ncbi:hypothetical protein IU402_06525 [Aerococcaceae bacterium zg-BR9]|uniref:hypothetical protein n=1 Tax=Aerococcaceae bacterium zg-1292 TaxID=2774330 RepID=UPI004064884A|nr:hypothetical protein [Aerococcaceae bacterium zg-BR9]